MSNPFDQFDSATPQGDSNPFDQFDAEKKKAPGSSPLRRIADIPLGLVKGIADLPGAAVGLADIPTNGLAGKAVDAVVNPIGEAADAVGVPNWARPTQLSKTLGDLYSPEMKQAKQNVHEAFVRGEQNAADAGGGTLEKFIGGIAEGAPAFIKNPAAAVALATENYGGMKAIAKGTAKMLAPAAAKYGEAVKAGTMTQEAADAALANSAGRYSAVNEGLLTAGQNTQQVEHENPDASFADRAMQGVAGAITGGISRGVSKIPRLGDVEANMALRDVGSTAKTGLSGGRLAAAGKSAFSEGVLEELPQSMQEQVWQNLGTNKPWDSGLAEQAVSGLVAGGAMGGAMGALSAKPGAENNDSPIVPIPKESINLVTDPDPLQERIDSLLGIGNKPMNDTERTQYAKDLESAFGEVVGHVSGKDGLEIPVTMEDYLRSQLASADITRDRPKAENAVEQSANRLQQLADEESTQQPDIAPPGMGIAAAPIIPVVGALSAAANLAVQTGAHAAAVAQQAAAQAAKNEPQPEGKAGTPAGAQSNAAAPAQGPLAEVAAQAPTAKEPANVSAPTQAAPQADQANAPNAGAKATEATGDTFIRTRTDAQLNWLAERGKPEFKAAAAAEIQKRAGQVSVAPEMPNGDGVTDQPTDTGIPMSVANQEPVKNASPTAATVSAEPVVQNQEPIKSAEQPASADPALQNRDRGRAASVNQMQSIARNPDYMRLGPSRTPDSGAPMVFAVGGDTNKISTANMGGSDIAVMADGQRVPFRYAVVDARSVEPSNFADGATNPAFASNATGTIKALNNGRTAGVRAAHDGNTAANYTAELLADQAHGVSPAAIRNTPNPMLVRVYAEQANTGDMAAKSQGQGLGMSASERATQDSELMTSDVLDKFAPGDIASAGNRDFVRAFVGKLAENELADMMDATGNLSQDGRRRIEAALLTAAYGKSDLVQELFESTDTDIKAIGNALKIMSGQWAAMRQAANEGSIDPDMDMTANLIEAVNIVRRSRAEGSSVAELAGQGDLMGGNYLNELSELFLRIFYKGKNYDRARGGDKVIAALQEIVTSAMNTKAEAGLFGDSFKATPKQIVESARSKIDEENKPASQSSLFGANGQATAVSQGNRSEGAAKSGEVGQRPVGTGRSEETGKQAEPVERSISDLQKELESAKFGERTELNGILIERVSEDAERSIKQGEMPMYQTGQGTFVALHPSAQQDGMIQATRYSDTGVFGDSQYKEVKEAVRDNGLWFKRRLPDAEAARLLEQSIAAEAEYQKRKNGASEPVAKAAEQSPAVDSKQSNDADLESRILIAADSIDKLRKVDVERVLMQGNIDRKQMADYIKRKRPEFSAEVDSVIEDATVEDNQKSEALDREMAGFTGVNDAEYELRQLSRKEKRDGDIELGNGKFVTLEQAVAAAKMSMDPADWIKPFQFNRQLDIAPIDWNTMVEAMKSESVAVDAEKPAESKAASATADAGEELTYNKRNRRAGGVKWDDIKDKNTALRVKEVVKAKVYPKPDYQALVDGGMKDVVAHIVKQAYDAIAPKPKLSRGAEASDEALQTYITAVNRVMDGVMKWASDDAAVAKWAAKQSKLAGGSINISELAAASTLLDTVYPNGWKANRDELIMLGGNKLLGALQPGYDEVGRAMRDIKLGWPASVESWQKQGMKVVHVDTLTVDLYASPARPNRAAYVSGMLSVGKQRIDTFVINGTDNKEDQVVQEVVADRKRELEGKYVLLDKSGRPLGVFDGEDSAAEAAREKAKKETGEKISEKGVSVEMAERVGIDHRLPGDDVTSERLKETFGFRGVNFGNWMQGDTKAKVAERQLHLNHLYDAFMDLAQLLNLPPKAMSLNGMLGIAVGAQGSGKALAHFVPGVNEINVTRTKGAGALAHEWGHALDHYFATMGGLDRKAEPYLSAHVGTLDGRVVDGKYVRSPVALAEVRPEVAEQFQSIVEAMTKRKETKEEYESRLKSEKSIAGRLVADEISKITKDIEAAKTGWGTPELVAKVRGLAERVAALDFGDGRVSVAGGEVPAVIAEIADAYLQASGAPLPNAYALGYHADRYKVIAELLESAEKWEPRTVTTDYQKASDQADGKTRKYWATKLEMFARAFDAYVVDSLAEKEEKNSYLSGIEAVAPQGDERKAIGKAFDFLFAELKTKETERGTAIYNITGKTDSLSPADTAIYGMASDGKSAAEILKFIASASRSPFYRQLAKLLMKTGITPTITVGDGKGWKMNAGEGHKYAAAYNPKTNTVSLFRPASAERNMLHEMLHAATLKALSGKGMASAQMRSLYNHVKKTGKLKGMYGMSDVDEFIAEAFSNPKFQDMLKKVAAPTATGGKLSSAWDWFVRVVRGILGLKQNDDSALAQALEIGVGVMREDMKLRKDGPTIPFAEISGNEIDRILGRTIQEKATNWMRSNLQGKSFVNDETGWDISVGRKGINKAMMHAAKDIHARSVAAIPTLLKNAVLVASEENRNAEERKSVPFVHHLYAPMRIGGVDYVARLVVKEAKDGTRFYDYETSDEISPAVPDKFLPFTQRMGNSPSARLDMSMAELLSYVKAEHGGTDPKFIRYAAGPKQTDSAAFRKWFGKSKVVDENGQPLVVYHGTSDDFTVFGNKYAGRTWEMFSDSSEYSNRFASSRGGRLVPVYLSLRNPLDMRSLPAIRGDVRNKLIPLLEDAGVKFGNNFKMSDLPYERDLFQIVNMAGHKSGFADAVMAAGYDGIIMPDNHDGDYLDDGGIIATTYIALNPGQIKSAIGNSGDFDGTNPDIRYNVADEGWSVSEPSKMDDLIYALQDKQIDMKRVVQSIMRTGKKVKDEVNAYLQEELFHGRAAKGVKDFLDFELRPLLKQMQEAKVDMGDFEEYLWNRHAEERNKQIAKINPDMPDGGSGIETAKARAYLAGLSAEQRKTFEALAAKVETMNRESQRVLVESGLEKQSTIDAWNNAYQHYVPLQREDVDNGHVGTGKGFSVRGSSTKRAMGSGKNVVDIIANLTMQRERNIVRAEKNRVSNALMGLAIENPNKDFWTVDAEPKERVVEETAIYTVVDGQGAKVKEFTNMGEAEKFARTVPDSDIEQTWGDRVKERVTPGFKNRDNVLLTRINGDDHYIIFNERDERAMRMATAMKNMDVDNLGRVLSLVGRATRYLSSINTQYNPVFGVINLIRDAQGALLNLTSTPLAGEQKRVMAYTKDALVGIYKDIRAHRAGGKPSSNWAALFEEFQKEGGQTGYRDQYANAEARAESIKSELEQFKDGKAKQLARGLFGWLSDYNETMENAVRLAAYKAAKEKGMSKQQAASLAKNITVNFNRKGQMATQVGSLYAFFNASVQGTARIAGTLFDMKDGDIRTARLSSTGKKIVYGGIMLGSMQALLLAAAGFGDDEPPDFIKERNLILPIGDGKYLTLAMPLGYHVFPGIGRLATEFVLSGGKDPLKKIAAFGSMFAEALNPIGNSGFSLQTITPSVIDPLAALAENRDFTGKEIYQNDFNKLNPTPGFTRAKDTATAWSKAIAEGLNFITGGTDYKPGLFTPTPDQIDYLIGQVTGGVGREVGKVSQVVSATTTGEDLPIYKVPLVGRFVGDTQGKSGESAKFYNSLREINMHEAEYKGLIGDGKRQEAAEYLAENPAVKLIMLGNQSERAVKKLKEAKRNLIENDAPQEKVAAMEDQIAKSMKLFNDRVTKALAQ